MKHSSDEKLLTSYAKFMVIWKDGVQQLKLEQSYAAHSNQGFLLQETSQLAALLLAQEDPVRVRELVMHDNLLQLRAQASRKTTYSVVMARLEGVPDMLLELLVSGSVDSRRLTNFYLILLKHRLLREFMVEVVVAQQQRLLNHINEADIRTFFSRTQDREPDVAAWSPATYQKAQSNLLKLVTSADLLVKVSRTTWAIQAGFVPAALRESITQLGHRPLLTLMLDQHRG